MLDELAKAVHLVSVIVWIAGMAVAATALRYPAPSVLPAIKAFDRRVTTPAMLLAWTFGLYLALEVGWFGEVWLSLKIVLVLVLSGLHGMITGRLRRMAWEGGTISDPIVPVVLPAGFVLVVLVVLLVTTKAF